MSRRPEAERSDWTDLDLLTRQEAYGRLQEEITETGTRLAELGDSDEAERGLLEARLRALREAAGDLTDNATTEVVMGRVQGKVALITGAARGQGRSHAVRLAEEGADVVVTDVCHDISDALPYPLASKEELDETVELVRATGRRCVAVQADVRSVTEVRAAVDAARAEFGRLDIVVANAGVMSSGSAWELSEEAWDVVVDVNLKGAWNTARAAIPWLIEAGAGGSIIMISSAAGIRGHVPYAHYVASKHGVVGLMKALSNELAPHRIRVNTVHPTGVSDTGISVGVPVEELAAREPLFALAAMNPLAPYVEPRDVSNAVLFLASDEGRYVTGLQFTVDAGSTNKP